MSSVDNFHVLVPWLICFMMLSDDLDSWQAGVNFQMITRCTGLPPWWDPAPKCLSVTCFTCVINLLDWGFCHKRSPLWDTTAVCCCPQNDTLQNRVNKIVARRLAKELGSFHGGMNLGYCTKQGRQNRTESTQRLSGITRQVFNSIFLITDTEVFADRQQVCAWLWEWFYLAWNRRY